MVKYLTPNNHCILSFGRILRLTDNLGSHFCDLYSGGLGATADVPWAPHMLNPLLEEFCDEDLRTFKKTSVGLLEVPEHKAL